MKPISVFTSLCFVLSASSAICEPMTFWLAGTGGNCNGCEWVAAQGDIVPETPEVFRNYVAEHGRPYHIMLDSPGGNLLAGIELGQLIRETGATTMIGKTVQETGEGLSDLEASVPGICASACAFAFMGGVERIVGDEDLLGVHQFSSADDTAIASETVQTLAGISLLHVTEMDIDPRVIVIASGTAPDDIYWFSAAELAEYGLDTTAASVATWVLEPYKDGLVLTTTYNSNPRRAVSVTLFCRASDRTWRMLIAEDDMGVEAQLNGQPLLNFQGEYPVAPVLHLGTDTFAISPREVEFERFNEGRISASFHLPPSILISGGLRLGFAPDLARVFGTLLDVGVDLPANDWIEITDQNCI